MKIIELDPCSNEFSNVKANIEFKLPQNGLLEEWNYKTIFVNPPYGRDSINKTSIKDWIIKCYNSHSKYKSEIIALIPVATNTRHWQNIIFKTTNSICFLSDTRLKFLLNGQILKKGAPMACAMIYWGNFYNEFNDVFKDCGKVIKI